LNHSTGDDLPLEDFTVYGRMEKIFMKTQKQKVEKSTQPPSLNYGGIYEIKIRGLLEDHWKAWFEGMDLKRQEKKRAGQECTLIIGPIADQPALHGLLAKIRDLNLILVSVRKLDLKNLRNQKKRSRSKPAERRTHLKRIASG
jgi:hypothetical protein